MSSRFTFFYTKIHEGTTKDHEETEFNLETGSLSKQILGSAIELHILPGIGLLKTAFKVFEIYGH